MAETLSFTGTLSTNGRDPKLYWDPKYKWQRPSVQILVPSLERTWPRFLFLHQRGRRNSDAGSIHSQCTLSWRRRAFLAVPGRPERALQRAHRHGHPMGLGRHGDPGAFNALCAPLRADFATGVARAARANRKASAERCGDRNQAPVANAHAPTCVESLGPVVGCSRAMSAINSWLLRDPRPLGLVALVHADARARTLCGDEQ